MEVWTGALAAGTGPGGAAGAGCGVATRGALSAATAFGAVVGTGIVGEKLDGAADGGGGPGGPAVAFWPRASIASAFAGAWSRTTEFAGGGGIVGSVRAIAAAGAGIGVGVGAAGGA